MSLGNSRKFQRHEYNHFGSISKPEISLSEAKARLTELIDRIKHGETETLMRHHTLAGRIVPAAERWPGLLVGRITTSADVEETAKWQVETFEASRTDDALLKGCGRPRVGRRFD
jgi:antitoxin (DNA-binding transcriptional repressor) of toxin-antitoxin stability system